MPVGCVTAMQLAAGTVQSHPSTRGGTPCGERRIAGPCTSGLLCAARGAEALQQRLPVMRWPGRPVCVLPRLGRHLCGRFEPSRQADKADWPGQLQLDTVDGLAQGCAHQPDILFGRSQTGGPMWPQQWTESLVESVSEHVPANGEAAERASSEAQGTTVSPRMAFGAAVVGTFRQTLRRFHWGVYY